MRVALSLGTVLASGLLVPAFAQTAPPADVRQSIDGNGVDLFSGKLAIQGPVLSIGGGDTGMRYYKIYRNQGWSDNMIATMNISGTTVTVTFGGTTDRFTQSGSTYTPTEANGATLALASSVYTYTTRDGTIAHFSKSIAGFSPFFASEGRVTDITSPDGEKLTFSYGSIRYCSGTKPGGTGTICTTHTNAYRLENVINRYGYRLSFSYPEVDGDPEDPEAYPYNIYAWGTSNGLSLNNLAVPGTSIGGTGFTNNYGHGESYGYGASGITTVTHPGSSGVDVTYGYTSGRITSVATAAGTTTYSSAPDTGGFRVITVTNPANQPTTYTFDVASQRMTSVKDANNYTTSYQYDANGRLTRTTMPEGNYVQLTLDARGNVTQTTAVAKPGSGLVNIVTSASYPTSCTNVATCNQPTSTTDARGAVTDYTYDPTHGGVLTVTAPAPTSGAVRPQTRYTYTQLQAYYSNGSSIVASGQPVYKLTGTSTCQVNATCAGTVDEVKTTISYGPQTIGVGNNLLPVSASTGAGDGSLTAITAVTYDGIGNAVTVDGPLPGTADMTRIRYDAGRQVVGVVSPDPDGAGPLKPRASRTSYDLKGRVTVEAVGTVTDQSDAAWANFAEAYHKYNAYDGADRVIRNTMWSNGTDYAVADYLYDGASRRTCTITYMNPASWGPQATSCTPLQTNGPNGPDRVTQAAYDPAGQVTSVTSGVGTSAASTDVKYLYTANGKVLTATDAENNRTTYSIDGFDRPSATFYPVTAQGQQASNSADYEQVLYDPNGNVTSRRLRDGQTIGYSYDALNRVLSMTRPAGEGTATYGYDLLDRMRSAYDPASGISQTLTYDALGRLTADGQGFGTITSQYDLAGRRTRETWNDGFYVTFNYLVTGEMSSIQEASGYTAVTFGYDDLGRRTSLTRGNGTVTSYGYDAVSRLVGLTQDLPGTANDLALGYSYNPASQIASSTRSNDAYAWTGHYNINQPTTVNGLNEMTAVGTGGLGYDARGNLITNGGVTYGYTTENLMKSASNGVSIYYDPLHRVSEYDTNVSTRYNYDGVNVATELNNPGGAVQRRYVYGPGADEPLIWYEGSGTSDRRYMHADERGSIVAVTDTSGNVLAKNSYDEYGVPGAGNLGRFQYTGQAWLTTLGLYNYKARIYSSRLGRFMQTDPIGYGDGMNWYNYVGSDPVNGSDPSGLLCTGTPATTGLPGAAGNNDNPCFSAESDPALQAQLIENLVTVTARRGLPISGIFIPNAVSNLIGGQTGPGTSVSGGVQSNNVAPQNNTCQRSYSPIDMASANSIAIATTGQRGNLSPLSSEFSKLNSLPNLSSSAGWRSAYTPHATGGGFEHDLPGGSGMVVKVYIGDTHNGGANTVTITSPTWSVTHVMEQLDYYGGGKINEQHAKKFIKGVGGC